jgi:hypothetical protein
MRVPFLHILTSIRCLCSWYSHSYRSEVKSFLGEGRGILGFEFRVSCLLGRSSTTWAVTPTHEVKSYVVLIYIYLWPEMFSISSYMFLAICAFSFEKFLFSSFTHFFIGPLILWEVILFWVPCWLLISYQLYSGQRFSPILWTVSSLVTVTITVQKLSSFFSVTICQPFPLIVSCWSSYACMFQCFLYSFLW